MLMHKMLRKVWDTRATVKYIHLANEGKKKEKQHSGMQKCLLYEQAHKSPIRLIHVLKFVWTEDLGFLNHFAAQEEDHFVSHKKQLLASVPNRQQIRWQKDFKLSSVKYTRWSDGLKVRPDMGLKL